MAKIDRRPHLLVTAPASTEPFTSPRMRGAAPPIAERDRARHGQRLLSQLRRAARQAGQFLREQRAFAVDVGNGIYLEFESEPGFQLPVESLEDARQRIEFVAVKELGTWAVSGLKGLASLKRRRREERVSRQVTPQPAGFYGGWITAAVVGPFKGGPGSEGWYQEFARALNLEGRAGHQLDAGSSRLQLAWQAETVLGNEVEQGVHKNVGTSATPRRQGGYASSWHGHKRSGNAVLRYQAVSSNLPAD